MSIGEQLRALNFHDSSLVSFHVSLGPGSQRTLTVELDYYDWEGNSLRRTTDPHAAWQTKRLTIAFGFLAAIEFSAPDLVNRAQEIDTAEVGYRLDWFKEQHTAFKGEFPRGGYPLFDDGSEVVSIRFSTQNNDDESFGYFWIVGSQVELSIGPETAVGGQTHFALRQP